MSVYEILEIQSIGSLYVKLPGGGNRLKLRIYGEIAGDIIKIEWLEVQPIVKIIVQDYDEILS